MRIYTVGTSLSMFIRLFFISVGRTRFFKIVQTTWDCSFQKAA